MASKPRLYREEKGVRMDLEKGPSDESYLFHHSWTLCSKKPETNIQLPNRSPRKKTEQRSKSNLSKILMVLMLLILYSS